MLTVEMPGRGTLRLSHLILDCNGTSALDGRLRPRAGDLLRKASDGDLEVRFRESHPLGSIKRLRVVGQD